MRKCKEYEITVERLLNVVHSYTERIKIYVITEGFDGHDEDRVREYYLTEDFSKNEQEQQRVLKYYADVPVWNLHIEFDEVHEYSSRKGQMVVASIVANCHYEDVRQGRLLEREDLRKAKRKAYREKQKAKKG